MSQGRPTPTTAPVPRPPLTPSATTTTTTGHRGRPTSILSSPAFLTALTRHSLQPHGPPSTLYKAPLPPHQPSKLNPPPTLTRKGVAPTPPKLHAPGSVVRVMAAPKPNPSLPPPPPPLLTPAVGVKSQRASATVTSSPMPPPPPPLRPPGKKKPRLLYPKVNVVHEPLRKRQKIVTYLPEKGAVGEMELSLVREFLKQEDNNQSQWEGGPQLRYILKKHARSGNAQRTKGGSSTSAAALDALKAKKNGDKGEGPAKSTASNRGGVGSKPAKKSLRSMKREVPYTIPENYLVSHTLALLHHKRELQKRLELIEEEGVVHRMEPFPELKTPLPKGQLLIPNIPLSGAQAKETIQNRMAILLSHGGYTHANQQPMEVLSDVLENFYKKMASRLKQVREMEMAGCEQEFPDPLERVLVEMNMGGVRGVQKFYKSRVSDYRKRLMDQCVYLRKLYAHKIRLKVGMVVSTSGGSSTCNSTSTSSQLIPPGNSVLAEILSGLEKDQKGSSFLLEEEKLTRQPLRPPQLPHPPPLLLHQPQATATVAQEKAANHPQKQHQTPHPSPVPSNSSNRPQSLKPNPSLTPYQPSQHPSPMKGAPQQLIPHQRTDTQYQNAAPLSSPIPKPIGTPPHSTQVSNNTPSSVPNTMVSINLNNNVDLGGFVTSPGASRTPTLKVNKIVSPSGTGDSKAKLKEALSQRNLLRLNFEQVPSSCDSTVLLSSSSPSLSSSSNSSSNKSSTQSSSLSQTTRLKL